MTSASQAVAWELKGKLAVKTQTDKANTNLYWLHTPEADELRLTSVLGTTLLLLKSTNTSAMLMVDGKEYHGNNAHQLLYSLTGWSLPLSQMPLWVTGQTSAQDQVISRDAHRRPVQLHTLGSPQWQIKYTSWQTLSGAEIPRLLTMKNDKTRLKIQVNQWQALSN
ncbi:lipoprotein insertase outer membrane protein LolB [Shewanella gelidii]|uniref:Outer-membrane lipoprotein LolB n=1 Tax=Shewanella gelidii TaxID=1642821 RepID=A0A917JKY2_9GAMM|nr:lipoprotein insertase outer membrane protein LolB [Shewanella gelidii]MCL1097076.1 lipoprotein insertase outer membrane protein LolB [Shewanella gelidii]GGI72403.1 outer-membrane lipoprotein LolB [Shewanella gelidii]